MFENFPKSINVACFDIAIELIDHFEANEKRVWGEFSAVRQRIVIDETIPTRFKLVDTLFHEIGHAIYWAYGINDKDEEERIVAAQATAWTQIFRDNKNLYDFIGSQLYDDK